MTYQPKNANGQATMANSTPMVIASDQTTIPVTEQLAPAYEDNASGVAAVQHKPIISALYSGTPFQASLTSVAISAKAAPGNLLSVRVSNINAAVRYLQIHNKASAPASTEVPVISVPIPAGSATAPAFVELGANFLGTNGLSLTTGVAIGVSTAAATYTAATTTDHVVNGMYV
ncbi:MAG: hypothetical protein ABIQ89_01200 [Candidatus Saccharimonadales bacterium]